MQHFADSSRRPIQMHLSILSLLFNQSKPPVPSRRLEEGFVFP